MTDLVKKHATLSAYLEAEEQLLPKLKEKEFEDLVGLYLKTDDFFGPNVYNPNANEVPPHLAAKWNITNLLKGERSEGADYYTECLNGTGVEVKYQHDDTSIKLHKLAVKEVALNKTNIKHRVLATNLSRVSSTIEDYLDNWTYVFGDDIYNEEVYQRIRNFVLQPRKKVKLKEVGYRPDSKINIGSTAFHYQSIKGLFDEIVAQIGLDGLARVLSIKPTAAGKGSDPILLWKHFLKAYFNKQQILTATINPSLTVLKGNLVKQTKDIKARGDRVRVVVLATDVSKGIEDAEELNLIKRYAEVVNGNEIIDVMLDWLNGNYHLHIETSIHSYWKLGEIMVAEKITGDFMYIDEVKHTASVEETSKFAYPLFDKHGAWQVRVGADANIVGGTDEKGNQMPTSMRNDTLWRSLTGSGEISPVVWSENDVSSRGWKRKTTLEIHAYDVNLLPVEIQNAVYDKKSAIIKINGVMAPQEWLFKLDTLARYMINHPNRKFPLLNLNTQKRVIEFIEFAKYAWPEVVGQYGDARNPLIRRMLDVPFVNIYSNGNTHNKIQRLVDGIPKTYTAGAIVCQVKKLSEGWDPEGGWVDGVMFVDASGSKTRISQTIGRGQRGPESLANVVIPETILVDPADQFSLKNQFKLIQSVAETLEIGEDNIEDCITFFDHINPGAPGAGRTKGSKYVKPLWELEGGLLGAFKGFVKEGTFNPHKNTVEEIFYKFSKEYLSVPPGKAKEAKAISEKIISEYPDYFSQFKDYSGQRTKITQIFKGKHWLLDTKLKVAGRKQWREYLMSSKRGYLQDMIDLLAAARATVGKDSIETLVEDKGKLINWLNALYTEFENITGVEMNTKGIKNKYRNIANGDGPCKNNYPWRNRIITKAINSIYEQELAKANALEAQQLEVLKANLSKLVIFSANSIGWAVEKTVEETGAIQHRLNKASYQFRDLYPVWQEQNTKLAKQLYRDNWQRFETIVECDEYVEQTLKEQGFLVGSFQLREGIRKKLPEWKTMEKEIRLKAAAKTVKVRKKYDVWNKGNKMYDTTSS